MPKTDDQPRSRKSKYQCRFQVTALGQSISVARSFDVGGNKRLIDSVHPSVNFYVDHFVGQDLNHLTG